MEDIKSMEDVVFGKKLRTGSIVEGTVLKIYDTYIVVDLSTFTEGIMHLDHYTKDKKITSFNDIYKIGDKITCEVAKVDDQKDESHIYLSRLNLVSLENYKALEKVCTDGTNITVKVLRKGLKGGYEVKYNEFTFFMPDSQAPANVEIGKNYEVRILELSERNKGAVVSSRVIEKEKNAIERKTEFDSFNVGDVLSGEIIKVEPFGAFVKFNFNQGLIRVKDFSHSFIKDLSKEVKIGDTVQVKIISKDNDKLALSRKALLKTPYELFAETHKTGDKVTGKCVNKLPFGLIIELATDVRGLLHQSEYSWNPNDNFNAFVKIGDSVESAILSIQVKEEKLSLSRKALMDNPWARVTAKEGDVVEAKIASFEQKGMIVSALGVDGFIGAFDAVPEGKNGKMDDYYSIGDIVTAVITEIDSSQWILKLSIRRHLSNVERKQFEKYLKEDKTSEEKATFGDLFKDVLK